MSKIVKNISEKKEYTEKNCPGIIKLFPARVSFVSDIPPGDRKIGNLFLQCNTTQQVKCYKGLAMIKFQFMAGVVEDTSAIK
jgi:hypothetical protein